MMNCMTVLTVSCVLLPSVLLTVEEKANKYLINVKWGAYIEEKSDEQQRLVDTDDFSDGEDYNTVSLLLFISLVGSHAIFIE